MGGATFPFLRKMESGAVSLGHHHTGLCGRAGDRVATASLPKRRTDMKEKKKKRKKERCCTTFAYANLKYYIQISQLDIINTTSVEIHYCSQSRRLRLGNHLGIQH